MAENPYVNQVVYGDRTLIDLTADTVTPESLVLGATAHDASGKQISGSVDPIGLHVSGATVGDLVRVASVDANGKPTSWNHVPLCNIMTNSNLLDNWYFVGGGSQQGDGYFPINQRGQANYPNAGYCIDRWMIGNGSLTLQNTGLRFSQAACYLIQSLSGGVKDALDGKTLTFSYFDSYHHLVTGSTVYRKQPAENIYFAVGDHYQLLINTNGDVFIWCADPTVWLSAVKLELGSYQTLAHNEGTEANPNWVLNAIPDWSDELRKCMRYYVSMRCIMQRATENFLAGNGTFPVPMVRTPSVTITSIVAITGFTPEASTYNLVLNNQSLVGIQAATAVFTTDLPYYVWFTATCED